jgi:hypothetical protein
MCQFQCRRRPCRCAQVSVFHSPHNHSDAFIVERLWCRICAALTAIAVTAITIGATDDFNAREDVNLNEVRVRVVLAFVRSRTLKHDRCTLVFRVPVCGKGCSEVFLKRSWVPVHRVQINRSFDVQVCARCGGKLAFE